MAGQLRAIRQRIRSIQSTAKITRAQELIAASRIIRARQRVADSAPYASELRRAVEAVVGRSAQIDHPLVREPAHRARAAMLVVTSDRGFCGGYNANDLLDKFTLEANKARQTEITQEISEIVGGANALAESIAGSE